MAIEGLFINVDVATLQQMQTEWRACLTAIAVAHQSYSIAGRTYTRADLEHVSQMVGEIAYALSLNSPITQRVTYADMSGGPA